MRNTEHITYLDPELKLHEIIHFSQIQLVPVAKINQCEEKMQKPQPAKQQQLVKIDLLDYDSPTEELYGSFDLLHYDSPTEASYGSSDLDYNSLQRHTVVHQNSLIMTPLSEDGSSNLLDYECSTKAFCGSSDLDYDSPT